MSLPSFVVLCRHYPPAISGGARRPAALVKGLRDLGARVFVVAPDQPPDGPGLGVAHPHRDPPTHDNDGAHPGVLTRFKSVLRETILLPDPDIRWARRAVAAAYHSAPFVPDYVLSTSPPESLHLAAAALADRWRCRLITDFRDHWLTHPLRPVRARPLRRWRERRIAKSVLSRSHLSLTVDDLIAAELKSYVPGVPVEILEQPAFSDAVSPPPELGPGVHIVHTGSFSLSDPGRRIEQALDLFAECLGHHRDLWLHLAGRITESEQRIIAHSPLCSRIVLHGLLSMAETQGLQRAGDAVLLVTSPSAVSIPGKYFEYRAAGRPILYAGAGAVQARLDPARLISPDQISEAHHRRFDPDAPTPEAMARQLLQALGCNF